MNSADKQFRNETFSIGIVGAGGLGIPALWSFVEHYSKSPTQLPSLSIRIFDFDEIELSNLNRQILFGTDDIGKPKAETLTKCIKEIANLDPDFLKVEAISTKLTPDNLFSYLKEVDCVLDATDSVSLKLSLNDFCNQNKKALASAGIAGFRGQIILLDRKLTPNGGCLRCVFPELSEISYQNEVATCQHSGIVGPVVGYLGSILGTQAFELFTNRLKGEALSKNFTRFDAKRLNQNSVFVFKDDNCKCFAISDQMSEIPARTKEQRSAPEQKNVDSLKNSLDLRKIRCPKTFLFTKMALEKLPKGEPLTILLATEKEADQVRRTSEENGYQILNIEQKLTENFFKLTLTDGETSK